MRALLAILVALVLPLNALAWGEKGHALINQLAIDAAAPHLPEFMAASRRQLIYNSNEPDRWREEPKSALNIAQAPDHFFDSEYWGSISTIPPDRYQFMEKVAARKIELARMGYLPYAIIENYQRLANAFRQWRHATSAVDRESARANALHYAGILGHYVGDGSQPLHLTIHFDGWAAGNPNPQNYTRVRGLHSRFEVAYVTAAIGIANIKPKVSPPQRLSNVFESVKQYLTRTFADVEPLYALEKSGEFNPEHPQEKGTQFINGEMARAASMLASLWLTAWRESGEPLPAR